jgi:putative SOS response-associated peptidase YedK
MLVTIRSEDGKRIPKMMRWGLLPHWAKDEKIAYSTFNARVAGLWAKWKDAKSGDEILSCTILTCRPNHVMAELHDRMPVMLAKTDGPRAMARRRTGNGR